MCILPLKFINKTRPPNVNLFDPIETLYICACELLLLMLLDVIESAYDNIVKRETKNTCKESRATVSGHFKMHLGCCCFQNSVNVSTVATVAIQYVCLMFI